MQKTNITEELIASCGMNCAICSRYLSYVNDLKRSQCIGCRSRRTKCSYLFEKCTGINNDKNGDFTYCHECNQYPCKQINRMDDRYRKNYNMSVKDNLDHIDKYGVKNFIEEQYKKYRCKKCGGLISIHNRKCFKCDKITKLMEKHS